MSVSTQYQNEVDAGRLELDPVQVQAAQHLDEVTQKLMRRRKQHWFAKKTKPKGLYMWGGVGRGKSMLMDMFVADISQHMPTRRVHFHAFMREVHEDIHRWRQMSDDERKQQDHFVKGQGDDPIPHLARKVAQQARVLAFDEFHVTQIADAMILSRLFTALFSEEVVVVATSNRVPEDLYINGLNRDLFLPFIDILKDNCDIFELASPTDYRLGAIIQSDLWHPILNAETEEAINQQWQAMTAGRQAARHILQIQGRELEIAELAGDIARMDFCDLCDKPLGAGDYLALCALVRVLFVTNIPKLGPENRNQAARFVTLIDIMYESKTILIASAETDVESLYLKGDGAFEFQRTISRLIEMRGAAYLSQRREILAQNPSGDRV